MLRSPFSRNKWQEQLSSSKSTELPIPDSLLPASQQNFLKWVAVHCCHSLALSPLQSTLINLPSYPPLTAPAGVTDKLCAAISKGHVSALLLPKLPGTLQEVPCPHSSSISSLGSVTPHFPHSLSVSASFFLLSYTPLS